MSRPYKLSFLWFEFCKQLGNVVSETKNSSHQLLLNIFFIYTRTHFVQCEQGKGVKNKCFFFCLLYFVVRSRLLTSNFVFLCHSCWFLCYSCFLFIEKRDSFLFSLGCSLFWIWYVDFLFLIKFLFFQLTVLRSLHQVIEFRCRTHTSRIFNMIKSSLLRILGYCHQPCLKYWRWSS